MPISRRWPGMQDSRLTQAHEVNEARQLLAGFPKADDLLAGLLLPDDAVGWAAAKADVTGDALAPDTVLPTEISRLVGLRDDIYLNDIWEVSLTDFHHKNEHRELYARGELKKEGPNTVGDAQVTRWVGAVYDPAMKTEVPAFMPNTTFTIQRTSYGASGDGEVSATRLSGVSSCLNRLELNRMTDAAGLKYERPLLRSSTMWSTTRPRHPLFKAYLLQQLGGVLKVRPCAWGLDAAHESLRDDLAELDRLCDNSSIAEPGLAHGTPASGCSLAREARHLLQRPAAAQLFRRSPTAPRGLAWGDQGGAAIRRLCHRR